MFSLKENIYPLTLNSEAAMFPEYVLGFVEVL